jgi:hypothetical protein
MRLRLPLALTVLVATAALVALALLPGAASSHDVGPQGATIDCPTNANEGEPIVTIDPEFGPPQSLFDVSGSPIQEIFGTHPIEVFFVTGGGNILAAEGTLAHGATSFNVEDAVVPNIPADSYPVRICWENLTEAGNRWWVIDVTFRITAPTPTPTHTSTPTPVTPTPTRTPTSTPTTFTPTKTPTATPVKTPKPSNIVNHMPYKPHYLDYVLPLLATEDLSIFGIEVTQAVQCFDTSKGLSNCSTNSVPLVAGKHTTARVHLGYAGTAKGKAGVPVRLHIFVNGVEYIDNETGAAHLKLRQDLGSANFWVDPNFADDIAVSFYAEVDPDDAYLEKNEDNNRFPPSGTINLTFSKRRTFDVMGWRMRYHPTEYTGNQYAEGWAVNSGGADWLEAVWPVRDGGIDYSLHSGWFDWTTNIGPGDETKVIARLKSRLLLEKFFPWSQLQGQERVHVWTPRDHFVRGLSDPVFREGYGVASLGDDNPGKPQTMESPGFGVVNFVHEVSHNSELRHTATGAGPLIMLQDRSQVHCDRSADDDSDWPHIDPNIQEFGFNPDTGSIYHPSRTYDFMSYCYGRNLTSWISPFHWTKQFNNEGSSGSGSDAVPVSVAGPALAVEATLDNPDLGTDDGGSFGTLHKNDGGGNLLPPSGSGYSIELRNGDSVLASQPFGVSFVPVDGDAGEVLAEAATTFSMAWADGATSVVLLRGPEVLDTVLLSANAPIIAFTDPVQHEDWSAGTTETVSWDGSDLDGDSLSYSLFYSKNGGSTFEILVENITEASYPADVDSVAGGDDAIFRVVASDGLNSGFADSASVSVPNKAPFVEITNPGIDAFAEEGGLVVFKGGAVDLEDGSILDESFEWSSNVDGVLGTGGSLPFTELSPGQHTITLTATDLDGAQASASIAITVGLPADVDARPSAIDPATSDDVKVIVTLPPGFDPNDIDIDTLLITIGTIELTPKSFEQLGDTDSDGLLELLLTLDGQEVRNAIPEPEVQTEAILSGMLQDDTIVQGTGQIALITPGDLNCSGTTDAGDLVDGLAYVAEIHFPNCLFAGDMDCSLDVTAPDILGILGRVAGVAIPSVACPETSAVSVAPVTQRSETSGDDILRLVLPAFLMVGPALIIVRPRRR